MDPVTVYVKDFLENGRTDSETVRCCLAYAEQAGPSRTIVFDGKTWLLDEAVLLPPDTSVLIKDCTIKQNDEVFDNVFRGNNLVLDPENPFGAPLSASATRNIRIIGEGNAKIVGCDVNRRGFHPVLHEEQWMVGDFWGWRTLQISLSRCEGFEIGGISFLQTRCWAMSFDFCNNGNVHDLHIESNVKNGDGIDFRLGCHSCLVENITGYTSDDTVACTALYKKNAPYPRANYLYPLEPAADLFAGDDLRVLDIHDIVIRNIRTGGRHHGVICLAADGLRVYNISMEDILEADRGEREAAVKIYTGYGGGYTENDLRDIHVKNVVSRIADYGVLCNAKMKNVVLEKIVTQKPGGKAHSISHWEGVTALDS